MKQINEVTRNQLIAKSKKASTYSKSSSNRWTAKSNCEVANTVKDYNKIDMNTFWKKDILTFQVRVKGESSIYLVTVEFNNILDKIRSNVQRNENKLDLKLIYNALVSAINTSDIKISCSCPDYQYRLKYQASKNGYNSGKAETRPSEKTNPDDKLGAGCKHILCVLNNADWLHKIASVINNYVYYCKDHLEDNYGKFIFPKLYGISYRKAIEMAEDEALATDEATINLYNALGKVRGQFKKGSNKIPASNKN